jgi:hypothetical protein
MENDDDKNNNNKFIENNSFGITTGYKLDFQYSIPGMGNIFFTT